MNLKTIFSLAWRNVWRSKYRSLIVITAIALSLWAGVFMLSFSWGMYDQRIREAISSEISHIQIHNPQYLDENRLKYDIANDEEVVNYIDTMSSVKAVAPRMVVMGMIASPRAGSGIRVNGIDPVLEDSLTGLSDKLIEGEYYNPDKKNEIIISEKLAEKLKVKLRNKVVITALDQNKTMTAGAYRIVGIYKTKNGRYDEMNVFIPANYLANQMDSTIMTHEIGVLLHDNRMLDSAAAQLTARFPDLKIQTWSEIAPELGFAIESFDQIMQIFMAIIMIALAFGIINTMLMAVLERTREIGMLMAVGMNKPRIFFMIMFETLFLALIGGPVGLLAAYVTITYFGHVGIDLSAFAEGLSDFGFDSMVYTNIEIRQYFRTAGMVVGVAFLASIYPAYKALSLNPVNAIRKL